MSPAMAVLELRKLKAVQTNWEMRNACSEASVRKIFAKLTREKKKATKDAAVAAIQATSKANGAKETFQTAVQRSFALDDDGSQELDDGAKVVQLNDSGDVYTDDVE
jgi:hypothetical protein